MIKTLNNNVMVRINDLLFQEIEKESKRYHIPKTKLIRAMLYKAIDSIGVQKNSSGEFDFEIQKKQRKELETYILFVDSRDAMVVSDSSSMSRDEVMKMFDDDGVIEE